MGGDKPQDDDPVDKTLVDGSAVRPEDWDPEPVRLSRRESGDSLPRRRASDPGSETRRLRPLTPSGSLREVEEAETGAESVSREVEAIAEAEREGELQPTTPAAPGNAIPGLKEEGGRSSSARGRKARSRRDPAESTHALAAPEAPRGLSDATDPATLREVSAPEEEEQRTDPEYNDIEPAEALDVPVEHPPVNVPSAHLRVEKGPSMGRILPIEGDALVAGRSRECDLVIGDPSISRRHFRLVAANNGHRLEDMGSGNGTRVNGKTVDVTELRHGMRIQIGTSTLLYELAGEEAVVAPPRPVSPIPVTSAPVIRPRVQPRPPTRPPIWLLAVGGLSLLAVVLVGILIGSSSEPRAPGSGDGNASLESEEARAQRLHDQGMEFAIAGDWAAALEPLEAALALDPENERYGKAHARAVEEGGHERTLEAAVSAMEAGRMDEAVGLLRSIPEFADGYPKAQILLASSKTVRRYMALESVRERFLDGDQKGAAVALEAVLAIAPQDLDALALKERIHSGGGPSPSSEVGGRPSAPKEEVTPRKTVSKSGKGASRASKKAATRSSRESSRKRAPKERATSGSGAAGIAAYRGSDFTKAAELFDAAAAKSSGSEARRFQEMARGVRKFEKEYRRGKSASSLAASTKPLERAYRADKKLGGHFSAELRPLLAEKYAKRAAEAYDRKVYGSAAIFARKSLEYDRGHLNAKGVLEKTQSKGKGMYDEAIQARSSGKKADAEVLFRQVLKILPSSELLHRKAKKALEEMGR